MPLYKSARKGIKIPRKPRKVNIYNIKLIEFSYNTLKINVTCGRGTYIRSLARDIARNLNTHGHLISLKRIRIGDCDQNKCISINNFPKWLNLQN